MTDKIEYHVTTLDRLEGIWKWNPIVYKAAWTHAVHTEAPVKQPQCSHHRGANISPLTRQIHFRWQSHTCRTYTGRSLPSFKLWTSYVPSPDLLVILASIHPHHWSSPTRSYPNQIQSPCSFSYYYWICSHCMMVTHLFSCFSFSIQFFWIFFQNANFHCFGVSSSLTWVDGDDVGGMGKKPVIFLHAPYVCGPLPSLRVRALKRAKNDAV